MGLHYRSLYQAILSLKLRNGLAQGGVNSPKSVTRLRNAVYKSKADFEMGHIFGLLGQPPFLSTNQGLATNGIPPASCAGFGQNHIIWAPKWYSTWFGQEETSEKGLGPTMVWVLLNKVSPLDFA